MSIHTYRRLTGLALGAALGLSYGLMSQFLNRIMLPGVPLYQPPLGPIGNFAVCILGGALLGLCTAWREDSVIGTIIISAIAAVLIVGDSLLQARPASSQMMATVINLVFVALPFWGMLVPVIAALRWGVNKLVEGHHDRTRIRSRLPVPVVLVLVVGLVGALSFYRGEARSLLAQTDALLRAGQAASSTGTLPAPLQAPGVGPFIERGQTPYTLAWEQRGIERYRIPRPTENFDNHSLVVARFKNGWNLVCLYVTPEDAPICREFEELPQ